MQYQWTVKHIWPLEHVWANKLPKRTLVLEEITDKERKWWIVLDFFKEKTELLDTIQVWDQVTCSINTKANEYKGKRYNSITCWKLEKNNTTTNTAATETDEPFVPHKYDDDLPF